MAKKKKVSSPPSGLGASRSVNVITCSWKKRDYSKQEFKWNDFTSKDKKFSYKKETGINKDSTSRKIKLDSSDYYPNKNKPKLEYIKFTVRGYQKDTDKIDYTKMSDWADSHKFSFNPPLKPTSVTHSQISAYTGQFAVKIGNHVQNKAYWATKVEYQSVLAFNSLKEPSSWGSSKWWTIRNSVTGQDTPEFAYLANDTDNITKIENSKYAVRWFRARVVGPAGPSSWVTEHFAYSEPRKASVDSATINVLNGKCTVDLTVYNTIARPIDYVYIQYAISDITVVTSSGVKKLTPNNPSWQTAEIGGDGTITPDEVGPRHTVIDKSKMKAWPSIRNPYTGETALKDVGGKETLKLKGIPFVIPVAGVTMDDQLIFVRAITVHSNKTIEGDWVIAKNSKGKIPRETIALSTPTQNGDAPILVERTGNLVGVEVYNNCNVKGVYLMVTLEDKGATKVLDVITTDPNNPVGAVTKNVAFPSEYVGPNKKPYNVQIRAAIGTYSPSNVGSGANAYKVYACTNLLTSSAFITGSGPKAPSKPTLTNLYDGNVKVAWNWSWESAIQAEIAWSDYELAMESNDTPSTFVVSDTKTSSVIIRNLSPGVTWYFWVRLLKDKTTTDWSAVSSIALTSAPSIPTLSSSKSFYKLTEDVFLTWSYVTTDGAEQKSAKIAWIISAGDIIVENYSGTGSKTVFTLGTTISSVTSVKINGTATSNYSYSGKNLTFGTAPSARSKIEVKYKSGSDFYKIVARVPNADQPNKTDQYAIVDPKTLGWEKGKTYRLVLKVTSDNNLESEDWSEPLEIAVPNPISCEIERSGEWYSLVDSTDPEYPEPVMTEFPLKVQVNGGNGEGLTTSVYIERIEDYFIERPDGSSYGGYKGETVYATSVTNSYQFEITQNDIHGYLDDTAYYRIYATVEDEYEQIEEDSLDFRIGWEHQAVYPRAEIRADYDRLVTFIKILDPGVNGYPAAGDCCDIYRRSVDGYELVYPNAKFGDIYIDPYPTFGEHGGHRIVYRTVNGDYITADNDFAWLDIDPVEGDYFEPDYNYIDFGNDYAPLMYNSDLSHSWKKDFKRTRYLGGSIEGDWNAGVERDGSVNASIMTSDLGTIEAFRRLAMYDGSCRVRTLDGSNYVANVDVSENIPYQSYFDLDGASTKLASYSLNVAKVDSPTQTLIVLGGEGSEGYSVLDWENATGMDVNRVGYGEVGKLYLEEG